MQERGTIGQVKSGVRIAGVWLLGILWLGLVFGGIGITFTPSSHSPALGWVLLAVAAIIFLITMDRWIKNVFSGLLAVATFNAFFCILTGHLTGLPSIPISHLNALGMTMFFAISTVLSLAFRDRKLRLLDRIAISTFVVCVLWQATFESTKLPARARENASVAYVSMVIALSSLLIAWAHDRYRRSPAP